MNGCEGAVHLSAGVNILVDLSHPTFPLDSSALSC